MLIEDEVRIVTESRLGSRLAAAPSRSHKLTMKCDFKIFFLVSSHQCSGLFSNARILHIYPSPFQFFLWFTLDDDEEEEYDEEAADDEQDGAGLGLAPREVLGDDGRHQRHRRPARVRRRVPRQQGHEPHVLLPPDLQTSD